MQQQNMTPNDSHGQSATSAGSNRAGLVRWFVMSALGLTVLTLTAAHAPARIKLIGLFVVGYGLAAGAGLGALARISGVQRRRLIVWLATAFIAAGEVGMAVEAHRLYAAHVQRNVEGDKNVLTMARLFREGSLPDDPQQRAQYEQMQQTVRKAADLRRREQEKQSSFAGYLRHRISPLGSWPDPWPAVFWLAEVLLGTAAGTWIMSRMTRTIGRTPAPPAS